MWRYLWRAQTIGLVLCLFFWGVSLYHLDRFPPPQHDEAWILSPGYNLFYHGIYGSDLMAGFYHIERHYFEFMPLMSVLQGASVWLVGVGVFQVRWLPVILGMVTLALTYAVSRRLTNSAVCALLLLLFWQWAPGGQRALGSGIPLIDIARIARYDILVPPLGLGALWACIQARSTGQSRYAFLGGLLAGLAGLAHLYGLFWLVGLLLALGLDRLCFSAQPIKCALVWLLAGVAISWSVWVGVIAFNWNDYINQNFQYSDRFNLTSPSFYLDNLLAEGQRYGLNGAPFDALARRPGFWLLVVGAPAAVISLSIYVIRRRARWAAWLVVLSVILPLLFALLIRLKTSMYLITLAPPLAMVVGWGLTQLWLSRRLIIRLLAGVIIALCLLEGGRSIASMHRRAARVESPNHFFAEIRQVVPPAKRIIGPPQYWLALTDRDYKSIILPFFLSNPKLNRAPVSFDEAMAEIGANIVLVDASMADFHDNYSSTPAGKDEVWTYLEAHHARHIGELRDNYGQPFGVYQIDH